MSTLKEQGFRFCVSPCKQEARWLHPAIYKAMHSDWIDVTEWESEKLLEFLLEPIDSIPAQS